jgi:hypothetical protein
MRNWSRDRLTWKGNRLCVGAGKRSLVEIEPDARCPGMRRARHPDGSLSDMVNQTRARDAATSLALRILQVEETRAGAPQTANPASAEPLPTSMFTAILSPVAVTAVLA